MNHSPRTRRAKERRQRRRRSVRFRSDSSFEKFFWLIALATMGGIAMDGFFSFEMQTGAPQAAAAAWSPFQIITVYVVARALDELTRGQNGV